jgi:hypothetical protein
MNEHNRTRTLKRQDGILVKNRGAAPDRINAAHTRGLFHYELTNLTSAGGNSAYPVATETVMYDVRVTQRLRDGSSRDITLFDSDGVRQVDIDCATVFLRSEPMDHRAWSDVVSVKVSGRIRPTSIAIRESYWQPDVTVRVHPEFALDITDTSLSLYEAIYVTDNLGRRYSIGTVGISSVDISALPDRIGRSTQRSSSRAAGLRRSSGNRLSR